MNRKNTNLRVPAESSFLENSDYNSKNDSEFVFPGPDGTGLVLYLKLPNLISEKEPISTGSIEIGQKCFKISKKRAMFLNLSVISNEESTKSLTISTGKLNTNESDQSEQEKSIDFPSNHSETINIENALTGTYVEPLNVIFIANQNNLWKISQQSAKTIIYDQVLEVEKYLKHYKKSLHEIVESKLIRFPVWTCKSSSLAAYGKIASLNFKESEILNIYRCLLFEVFFNSEDLRRQIDFEQKEEQEIHPNDTISINSETTSENDSSFHSENPIIIPKPTLANLTQTLLTNICNYENPLDSKSSSLYFLCQMCYKSKFLDKIELCIKPRLLFHRIQIKFYVVTMFQRFLWKRF